MNFFSGAPAVSGKRWQSFDIINGNKGQILEKSTCYTHPICLYEIGVFLPASSESGQLMRDPKHQFLKQSSPQLFRAILMQCRVKQLEMIKQLEMTTRFLAYSFSLLLFKVLTITNYFSRCEEKVRDYKCRSNKCK